MELKLRKGPDTFFLSQLKKLQAIMSVVFLQSLRQRFKIELA